MFDDRFARQNRFEPPSGFLLTSPYTGIVHHLSGRSKCVHTQICCRSFGLVDGAFLQIPTSFSFLAPLSLFISKTHTFVALLGPCFKTGWFWAFRSSLEAATLKSRCCFRLPQCRSNKKWLGYNSFLGPTFLITLLPKTTSTRTENEVAKLSFCKESQQPRLTLLKNGYPSNNFKFF